MPASSREAQAPAKAHASVPPQPVSSQPGRPGTLAVSPPVLAAAVADRVMSPLVVAGGLGLEEESSMLSAIDEQVRVDLQQQPTLNLNLPLSSNSATATLACSHYSH